MKNTFKFLVNCLLSVSFFFSLFLFPVLAEVPTSYTLSDTNLIGLLNYPDLDLSTDVVYVGNNGRLQIISPRFGSVTIANNEVKYTGKRIEYDGSKWNDVNANGTVTLGFSWGGLYFLNIPNQQKFCKVVTNASSVPDCVNQLSWSADFNSILSDPYIAYLVGTARDSLIDDWYIDYQLYRSSYSDSRFDVVSYGFESSFSLYDSNDTKIESVIISRTNGVSCASDGSGVCKVHTAYSYKVSSDIVLKSNWLNKSGLLEVNDSKGNSLIESGNSSSQSASSSLNNTTSDFNDTALELESFESQFNSGMSAALGNIDLSGVDLGNVSDFVSTADFIKLQFDTILDNSGIYKSVITFSLILGLALLLIGRRS